MPENSSVRTPLILANILLSSLCTFLTMSLKTIVMTTQKGSTASETSVSFQLMYKTMMSEPMNMPALASIWTATVESIELIASMSFVTLVTSLPMGVLLKSETERL